MAVGAAELQQQALGLHQRLLRNDPTASADAAELLLDPLVARLSGRWPGLAHTDACHDTAVEVLVTYLADPTRYDQSRASLLGWLIMQAHADLKNDHASRSKRFERAWLVESALPLDSDTGEPPTVGEAVASLEPLPDVDGSLVLAAVRQAFPDTRDRQLIWLMCIEGSRSSDDAARVLGLEELAPSARAAEVKRHKDRVMRRLRRLGLEDQHE